MKTFKFLIPTIISILLVITLISDYKVLNLNLGNFWLNINSIYIIVFGLIISYLAFLTKLFMKVCIILAFIFTAFLMLFIIDSITNISNQSLLLYLSILSISLSIISFLSHFKLPK